MMRYLKALGSTLLVLSLFGGCGAKNTNEVTNQTPLYWHNKIYSDIENMSLDMADDKFTSLEIEHPNSEFIPIDLLILSRAHYKNGEYQLAEFYLDEYEKRYANRYEKEWCEYTKVKYRFFSIQNAYTNQKKLIDLLKLVKNVLNEYPNSVYNYELNTIKRKLELTNLLFDNQISDLYKRLNDPKAAQFYKKEINVSVIPPQIPWYKKIFYW